MATATKKKSKVSLQPLGDKVVVSRDESQEVTVGGIYLPDSAKDKPSRGTIIARRPRRHLPVSRTSQRISKVPSSITKSSTWPSSLPSPLTR